MPGYYGLRRYGYGPGSGWGRGFGSGGGCGRGWCRWPQRPWCRGGGGWGPPPWMVGPYGGGLYGEEPPYASPREEMADLKEQEEALRGELEAIQKRLAELGKEAPGQ
ncbi:MAG: DUF5320 domain-containing protein [Thermodesulfobacteriota bacterium]